MAQKEVVLAWILMEFRILMGASKISSKNETLCRVSLNSLPNTLQRELQIEVVVKINEDGDITVVAREILTHSQPVTGIYKDSSY
jgi:hypothetical protein